MCIDLVSLQDTCGRVHLLSGAVGTTSAVILPAAVRGGSLLIAYIEFLMNHLQ